jgi:membrane protein DedA with SNARE-associated domain
MMLPLMPAPPPVPAGRTGAANQPIGPGTAELSKELRRWRSKIGLDVVFARYLPGGRSATALAAGIVGYPAARFHWYTATGVVLWAAQAALLGYLGGALFADRPLLGLLLAWGGAAMITGAAVTIGRSTAELSSARPVSAAGKARQDL